MKNSNNVHSFVKALHFENDEQDEKTLADAIARVAEKNGMSANDVAYVFPYILRMLKSDIDWAK